MDPTDQAKALLAEHGNATDALLFERAAQYSKSAGETTQASVNGIISKRRRADIESDNAVLDELAMILSWRIGYTQSFWRNAAHTAGALEAAQ
jgi:hypothetical protein